MNKETPRKRGRCYAFAPMLGPADHHPTDSVEFAICLGNELDYLADRLFDPVDAMLRAIKQAIKTQAWLRWDPPSADAYFRASTGLTYRQLFGVIDTLLEDHGLPLEIELPQSVEDIVAYYADPENDWGGESA